MGYNELFSKHLRDMYLQCIDVDKEKLSFEREKLEMKSIQNEKEREERIDASIENKELKRFRLMIQMFGKTLN